MYAAETVIAYQCGKSLEVTADSIYGGLFQGVI